MGFHSRFYSAFDVPKKNTHTHPLTRMRKCIFPNLLQNKKKNKLKSTPTRARAPTHPPTHTHTHTHTRTHARTQTSIQTFFKSHVFWFLTPWKIIITCFYNSKNSLKKMYGYGFFLNLNFDYFQRYSILKLKIS